MSALTFLPIAAPGDGGQPDHVLAASITRAASSQTYHIIRLLVDRGRTANAFRAYGYFRWLDDTLDRDSLDKSERLEFVERQKALVKSCYRGEWPRYLLDGEHILVELIRSDREKNSGLQAYIRNMMAVMAFDAQRRGQTISQKELSRYTGWLAAGVTEALHYFIGHGCWSPHDETRYLAVTAAHITHMLRDTLEDTETGYFNIPREVLDQHHIDPADVHSEPYRKWVESRVQLAKAYFKLGKGCLLRVENLRCRLAGYAYTARFETTLDAIEQDGYRLKAAYRASASPLAGVKLGWSLLGLALQSHRSAMASHTSHQGVKLP